jgi:aldehyde dehydrogenase (NAD+)
MKEKKEHQSKLLTLENGKERDLDTGIVYVNAGTTGAEIHLPFGGTKATGNGHRDSGVQALDVFKEWKAFYVDYSGKLQRAQIDVD